MPVICETHHPTGDEDQGDRTGAGRHAAEAGWIGNGVLDSFLEDESLFGEFLQTPVSAARVEPLLRMPWTQRRGVGRTMSYSALISRDGLPLSHDCTICRLNVSS